MTTHDWDVLSSWLAASMAAAPAERERLRAALADEHPHLVADADRLWSGTGQLDGFLETPALLLEAHALAGVEDSPELPAGSMAGPYRVVHLIAHGGMGDVYRATDVRLGRDVALKVVTPARSRDPQRLDRFMREARVTAAIDHPNVVRVFDVGRTSSGAYIVAELLEGETLRARIARGPLPVREAVTIASDIARGLVAAHNAGLVHRDLKPDNVFLTTAGTTKILDFGIAKLTQDELVGRDFTTMTVTGAVLGTVGYLSPEQVRGGPVNGPADLFALGAVLFEMLTGTRAFRREHTVETLHAILHDPPSDALVRRADVPPELVAIVMRLLEKSPDARFQTPKDLVAALEHVTDTAVPASPRPRRVGAAPGRVLPRPRTIAWAALAIASVLAGIGAVRSWTLSAGSSTDGEIERLAVFPFRSLPTGDNDLLEVGLADALINRLSQLQGLRVLPLTATESLRGADAQQEGRRLGVTRVLTGTLQRADGLVRANIQLWSPADERTWSTTVEAETTGVFVIQDKIIRSVLDDLAPQLGEDERLKLAQPGTGNNEAFEAYLRGRAHVGKPTPADLRAAADYFHRAVSLDANYADAWAGLGSAYKRMPVANAQEPEALSKAREFANRALAIDSAHAEAHSVLGTVAFWHDWDYDAAERYLERALALQPSNVDARVFLAHVLSNVGRFDEAIEQIGRARALDPAWPVPRSLEGQIFSMARRHEEAVRRLDALIADDPGFWNAHLFRVWALIALGQYAVAIDGCDRLLEVRRRIDPVRPYPGALAYKAYAFARMGRRVEALQSRDQFRAAVAQAPLRFSHHEAIIHQGLGQSSEAIGQLRTALARRELYLTFLGVDPIWDDLRSDPGFRQLLKDINLLDASDRVTALIRRPR